MIVRAKPGHHRAGDVAGMVPVLVRPGVGGTGHDVALENHGDPESEKKQPAGECEHLFMIEKIIDEERDPVDGSPGEDAVRNGRSGTRGDADNPAMLQPAAQTQRADSANRDGNHEAGNKGLEKDHPIAALTSFLQPIFKPRLPSCMDGRGKGPGRKDCESRLPPSAVPVIR